MEAREVKNEKAVAKNTEEVQMKIEEYKDYMNWKNHGIVPEMERIFGVKEPVKEELLTLARMISKTLDIELDRQDKRRRDFLIGWFNKNFEIIRPILSKIVRIDPDGVSHGEHAEEWEIFKQTNPTDDLVVTLEK